MNPDATDQLELLRSMVGRTITGWVWCEANSGFENQWAIITLDDGRRIHFGAWGHSVWGVEISEDDEAAATWTEQFIAARGNQ